MEQKLEEISPRKLKLELIIESIKHRIGSLDAPLFPQEKASEEPLSDPFEKFRKYKTELENGTRDRFPRGKTEEIVLLALEMGMSKTVGEWEEFLSQFGVSASGVSKCLRGLFESGKVGKYTDERPLQYGPMTF